MRELKRRLFILLGISAVALILTLTFLFFEKRGRRKTIVVGGKCNTEQMILGEMLAILIEEKTGMKVKRNLNLDGSFIAFNALRNGDVDLYVEYTGTLEQEILKGRDLSDFDLEMGPSLGFDNSYVVLVHADSTIETLSEWSRCNEISFSCDPEFSCRSEYTLLCEHYAAKERRLLDYSLSLLGLKTGRIGSCIGCSTSAFIISDGFRILEDDKEIFPKYAAIPVFRRKTLRDHPELREIIQLLSHSISTDEMRRLNYEVDINGKNVYNLSLGWLVGHDLIGVKENGRINESIADNRQVGMGTSSAHSSTRRRTLPHPATARDSI